MKAVLRNLLSISLMLMLMLGIYAIGSQVVFAEAAPTTNVRDAVGMITTPTPNTAIGSATENGEPAEGIPLYFFVTWGLTIFTVIAGIWALYNLVFAAFTYLGGNGDPGSHEKVKTAVTNTVIGLLLIVLAYTITAIVSMMLFGSPTYYFNPTFRKM